MDNTETVGVREAFPLTGKTGQLSLVQKRDFVNRYGYVELFLFRSNHNKDPVAYIHSVYIKPFYRSRGYGSKLVRAAWKWARRNGAYKCFLVCRPDLERFYIAAGLQKTGIQMQKVLT